MAIDNQPCVMRSATAISSDVVVQYQTDGIDFSVCADPGEQKVLKGVIEVYCSQFWTKTCAFDIDINVPVEKPHHNPSGSGSEFLNFGVF
eukprot:CAMPEP_0115026052 /NCGR_PEP_ID=MMETSP0216-20121206/34465_1 /TAXON_ID=223996 /ORGANISM="Protocruzia adherens, Strain Boccale" /LENGTH=89 /DNA_ID=CAMNT_0002400951 /DNA_START=266 /DNA_END=532 /DNA_ORIENTATION=+